jgi:hypothetical protein
MPRTDVQELKETTDAILNSKSMKKLIVAGPGTGKTFIFKELIKGVGGANKSRIVLTFINTLKADLQADLSSIASVFTFHGYCYHLLRKDPSIRGRLTNKFDYYPGLAKLIISDWNIAKKTPAPRMIGLMRDLKPDESTDFFLKRSDYYNAISFDDSVFRVYQQLHAQSTLIQKFNLVLVDEFQDFNRLEVEFIQQLASQSPIVIAGDDDQALYGQLRGASRKFIRAFFNGKEYENHQLPFCMRCPEVIVVAVLDLVTRAKSSGLLIGRIEKPYKHFPPKKGTDSKKYPTILVARCTVQSLKHNYFGRYIADEISRIPSEDISESHKDRFPTVLIVGPKKYLSQIAKILKEKGYSPELPSEQHESEPDRDEGLRFIAASATSQLGWRIILEIDQPKFYHDVIIQSVTYQSALIDCIPREFKAKILAEADALEDDAVSAVKVASPDETAPRIKLTSFEGSKGLSAQHVFIVGLQEGELPKSTSAIKDVEVCKLLVALTRTRKQCHVVITGRFDAEKKKPSAFLSWITSARKTTRAINAKYWATKGEKR